MDPSTNLPYPRLTFRGKYVFGILQPLGLANSLTADGDTLIVLSNPHAVHGRSSPSERSDKLGVRLDVRP